MFLKQILDIKKPVVSCFDETFTSEVGWVSEFCPEAMLPESKYDSCHVVPASMERQSLNIKQNRSLFVWH